MQLFLNATSPFARLARVVAIEKGLIDQVELVGCDPWNNDPALLRQHPQARIPVLVTDDGQAIAESLLVAQYLDHIGQGRSLVPSAQISTILARTSVAYGLMEAAFNLVIARKNDGVTVADASVMGQRRLVAIHRVLAQLEAAPPETAPPTFTLDSLATAIALDYIRFRLPQLLLNAQYPALCRWLEAAHQHPSLSSTRFV